MTDTPLNAALRQFEATEANLVKIEKMLGTINSFIPNNIAFGSDPEYDDACRIVEILYASLPKIDGWKPDIILMELNEIARDRLDARDVEFDIPGAGAAVEQNIEQPFRIVREYRFRFSQKRRELIRDSLISLMNDIDNDLIGLRSLLDNYDDMELPNKVDDPVFDKMVEKVSQIDYLLGSSSRPERWSDLQRHIYCRMKGDLRDIIEFGWPSVKQGIHHSLYGETDPIPVDTDDLGTLVNSKPSGSIVTKLQWDKLSAEDFERLIFALISSETTYENSEWLMNTNAPDRGRDLSSYRIYTDSLSGTRRCRIIIQCKHWLNKSIGITEIASLKEQMKLWEPPRVDIHVIATSGRFTSDAVAYIEKHNQSDSALTIEMWPESHLERLLASRPAIIAEFSLR